MSFKTRVAIAAARFTYGVLRMTGRGGTTLPGKVALRINPHVLKDLSKGVTSIAVTGTNGKTTVSRMIEESLIEADALYFSNKSGANMSTGIATAFILNSTWGGRCKADYALLECDELSFPGVSENVDISVIAVTNIFRDQLDRAGEVTRTLEALRTSIKNSPQAKLVLNADDSLVVSLAHGVENETIYYGMETPVYKVRVNEISDADFCIKCGTRYEYDYTTYGHLGAFICPNCGYHSPDRDVAVTSVDSMTADTSTVTLRANGVSQSVTINLPAAYNIYNAAACFATNIAIGLDSQVSIAALSHFEGGFGRMEKFVVDGTDMRMILVKNPAGCNQVLNWLCNIDQEAVFIIALNDNYADGTDISWIWDVDFEKLADVSDRLGGVWVSGIRADDMAVRISYAGVPESKIVVEKDFDTLLAAAFKQDKPVFLMPTYTAMTDLRNRMTKNYGFTAYWDK